MPDLVDMSSDNESDDGRGTAEVKHVTPGKQRQPITSPSLVSAEAESTTACIRGTQADVYVKNTTPHWDKIGSPVDQSQLLAQESVYRGVNDHRCIVPVGRCLTCEVEIKRHQEIGEFVGDTVSSQEVTLMSPARGSYLLDMAIDGEKNDIEILDCYEKTHGENPVCKLSMANTAAALYHREADISLTEQDNNAAVTVVLRDGNRTAVMYALRRILVGEEIMWDYDIEHEPTPNHTPAKRLDNNIITPYGNTNSDKHPPPDTDVCFDITDSQEEDMKCLEEDMKCLAVAVKDSFDEGFAILDCASGTHICKNKEYAQNIRPCMSGSISGISGEQSPATYTSSCVFVDEEFGRMPLLQSAAANILSLASAKDSGFQADYNNNFDEFTNISVWPYWTRRGCDNWNTYTLKILRYVPSD